MVRIASVLVICMFMAGALHADAPVITSLSDNGQIEWSNSVNTNARYRIQWSSDLAGLWCNSFQSLENMEAHSGTSFSAAVPMFYRVVMTTNPPPTGMVLIDAGKFTMGNTYTNESGFPWYADETPVHTVSVSSFYIDRYEVSKALWDEVYSWATANGYSFTLPGSAPAQDHPVTSVNWHDCLKWCNARSQMKGLTPVYYISSTKTAGFIYKTGEVTVQSSWVNWDADGYRLPTEAEWERAARGGREGHHYAWESFGGYFYDCIDSNQANYAGSEDAFEGDWISGFPYTTPIGYFRGTQVPHGEDMANGYGLYDMTGNVLEWCWDWFGSYSSADQTDPTGPASGTDRILRGGCWDYGVEGLRCSTRSYDVPTILYAYPDDIGFRCVRRP